MKSIYQYLEKRLIGYCAGFFVLATGVCFCIASQMGVSPISSIPYVVSQITGFDLGLCTTVIFTVLVLAQAVVLGRKFKPILFLQVVGASIFGMFVSLASKLFVYLPPAQGYAMQLVYCALGVLFIAVGVLLYLSYNIVSLPVEGLAQALSVTYHKEFSTMKMCVDWTMVLIAIAISWFGAGAVIGVREGTLIAAFGVGMVMKPLQKMMKIRQGHKK